jgi:hypothetical protein
MEWKWTVEAVIAVFALILSGLSLYQSNKASNVANKLNDEANLLTKGQVEIQIREMISLARHRYIELGCKLASELTPINVQSFINAALEDYMNTYDEACAKYLDGKVDKERFKKLYINEIKNLVEDKNTKEKYTKPQTKYNPTVKVYEEWHNHEK